MPWAASQMVLKIISLFLEMFMELALCVRLCVHQWTGQSRGEMDPGSANMETAVIVTGAQKEINLG